VLAPPQVSENPFLPYLAGQPLDGGTSLLLLTRVDDRLRAESLQHPAHRGELYCSHRKGQGLSRYFGLQAELAPLSVPLVHDQIAYDPGMEIGDRSDSGTTVFQSFDAHHARAASLVTHPPGNGAELLGSTLGE
jgi:hypothetical protein